MTTFRGGHGLDLRADPAVERGEARGEGLGAAPVGFGPVEVGVGEALADVARVGPAEAQILPGVRIGSTARRGAVAWAVGSALAIAATVVVALALRKHPVGMLARGRPDRAGAPKGSVGARRAVLSR